ncbi:glycosyltransferase family 4 protein [Candidatus Parcubacteria bacterium]|jgi:phosphatidyl-myo-inositol dimannoside synthase|nr:glycosyltransferase family 4 protein [Candidatus Parcubacteria bacterium]MBT3949002.1 glycosyltransferase family 4 protein [Candidatus Parcubacteria bacterium]
MKKILITTLEYPPQVGGVATYVHQMAQALDKEKVVVLAPKMKGDKEWDENVEYKVVRKNQLFPKFVWPRWLKLIFQIRKIVKQEGIEIILINHVLPVGYAGWFIKKMLKIPYVIISHGTDILMGTRNKWKIKMMKKVVVDSEQIIFNSESLKRRFLQVLPEFTNKSTVSYPCPDKEFLTPPPQEEIDKLRSMLALGGKKVMLTVSRIEDGKGFPHLVRTMPELLKKEPHLVWLIVGDGPKKEEILKDIQKHSLQNVVRYVGEVPHKDLKVYYYLADVFALFTHPDEGREEGLGLVFLEAAAAGLPTVAGKSGGVEEAVLHTQTGIVIDVRQQAMAMDDAILQLLENEEYATRLGAQAKKRIETSFRWESQLKKLEAWIGKL